MQAVDGLTLEGVHAHIGSQLLELEPFRREVAELAEARRLPGVGPRRRPRRALHRAISPRRRRSRSTSARSSRPRGARHGRRAAPADRAGPRRCARTPASRSTRSRASSRTSRAGWPSTAACPTTCARCSTGRRYEAHVADRFGGATECVLAGKHCESGDVIVRDALLDGPAAGRRDRDARHRRLRLRDGQQLQRRAPPAGDLLPRRRRARGRPARELRGSDRARCPAEELAPDAG